LAFLPLTFIARLTRTKLIKELKQDYILTARAKGLPERVIIFRHALRNAIAPVIGFIGPLAANIFTGSFIVEKIYSIPGLGYWFVASVSNRDYPVIMGITVFYCSLILLASLIVDSIYAYLDPRVSFN
jgi:oligopeptide transport system permease protein